MIVGIDGKAPEPAGTAGLRIGPEKIDATRRGLFNTHRRLWLARLGVADSARSRL